MTRAQWQIISGRQANLGEGFSVTRLVPTAHRRMIGAWCFLDHAAADFDAGHGMQVGPHPHMGLQTFTWMVEGEILHRDSLGVEQLIRPGQVNLMTSGRGITHSEESPHQAGGRLHVAQLWIALPDAHRHTEPAFHHYAELPMHQEAGIRATVLVGKAWELAAPTQVYSPLVAIHIKFLETASLSVPLRTDFEHGIMQLNGEVTVDDQSLQRDQLMYSDKGADSLKITGVAGSQCLLIGGEPFNEPILMWWNFVGRTAEDIQQAAADWTAGRRFPEVPHSTLARLQAPDLTGVHLKPRSPLAQSIR